jgi:aldose 1-epimerase
MSGDRRRWTRRAAIRTAVGTTAATALAGRASAQPARLPAFSGEQTPNGRLYEIRSGRHRAVVAGVAATLLSWQVDGTEMLLTHPADQVGEGYQGKTILPWPNRIDQGQYTFDGQDLQVPINEPSREAALHGLMGFVEWQPVRHQPDRVALEYILHPHYGYPFWMAFQIEFAVDDRGVRSTLTAKNIGKTDAPFGTANHSYIAAGDGTIDSIVFELPASTYYLTNDRLIPTGTASVEGTEYDFRSKRPLGSTTMDTAFTDLARGSDGTAVVRFERPEGEDVELWVDGTHKYLQVYTDDTPDADRPPRAGITVEPMTCAPNAFVTGDGLITLRPGETHEGSWGYRVPA